MTREFRQPPVSGIEQPWNDIGQVPQGPGFGLESDGEEDDPPRIASVSRKNTTEDRQDDIQADSQSRQGVVRVSRTVYGLLSQPARFRFVQNLCPGLAIRPATKKRRGHCLGIWQGATYSTAFRGIDQVARRRNARHVPTLGRARPCARGSHRLPGRIRNTQERHSYRRRRTAMVGEPRQGGQWRRRCSPQLLRSRLSVSAG